LGPDPSRATKPGFYTHLESGAARIVSWEMAGDVKMAANRDQKVSVDDPLVKDILDAFDHANGGIHAGFRPAHAKGVMASGTFTPTAEAAKLTKAPHVHRPQTPVVVRFSDFAGVPGIADNAPNGSGPRGMAVRFYLDDHVHTDIVAHSTEGFPTRTPEEFLGFLRALGSTTPDSPKPTPIEQFLAAHPKALQFVMLPKPIPTSFAHESFFGMAPFRFTNSLGDARHGRFRLLPFAGNEHFSEADAAKQSPDFLMDELAVRLKKGPIRFRVVVQLAGPGDDVADATTAWPQDRPQIELGALALTKLENHDEPELRKIIFDPIPRVDGIDPAGDPLLDVRAAIYLRSGRRRRVASEG
jgi:catalase